MTIENHLETFRLKCPLKRVTVEDDYLIYKVSRGTAKRAVVDSNELIVMLDLPLVAIGGGLWADDSFIVKTNETEI
jgi:hypothetical protein